MFPWDEDQPPTGQPEPYPDMMGGGGDFGGGEYDPFGPLAAAPPPAPGMAAPEMTAPEPADVYERLGLARPQAAQPKAMGKVPWWVYGLTGLADVGGAYSMAHHGIGRPGATAGLITGQAQERMRREREAEAMNYRLADEERHLAAQEALGRKAFERQQKERNPFGGTPEVAAIFELMRRGPQDGGVDEATGRRMIIDALTPADVRKANAPKGTKRTTSALYNSARELVEARGIDPDEHPEIVEATYERMASAGARGAAGTKGEATGNVVSSIDDEIGILEKQQKALTDERNALKAQLGSAGTRMALGPEGVKKAEDRLHELDSTEIPQVSGALNERIAEKRSIPKEVPKEEFPTLASRKESPTTEVVKPGGMGASAERRSGSDMSQPFNPAVQRKGATVMIDPADPKTRSIKLQNGHTAGDYLDRWDSMSVDERRALSTEIKRGLGIGD